MSNPTYTSRAFKSPAPAAGAPATPAGLLRELFAATPLSIFINAVRAARKAR